MEPGHVIFKGKTSEGVEVAIRYPKADDLQDLLQYINALSRERTYVSFQGEQLTEEEEKKFLDSVLEKMAKNEDIHLLAYSNNKLIGVTNITLKEKNNKHVAVYGISVASQYRNQGLGELLMAKILEDAKNNLPTLKIVTLEVFANNNVAIELYKKFGFRQYGRLPKGVNWRDTLVDKVLMYKNI